MWRPRLLLREAYRNLGPRHTVLGLALAVVLGIVGIFTSLQAVTAIRQQEAQWERGAAVWWVQSGESGPVPARLCAELNRMPGVVGAGAVGRQPASWFAFAGARGLDVDAATPGTWAAWGAPQLEGKTVAGADLVELRLVSVGSLLSDEAGRPRRIDATTPPAVQPTRLRANVVIAQAPDFAMSECWVRMEQGSVAAGADLLAFAFSGHEVQISPFAADDSVRLSPLDQWRGYANLLPGAVAGALIGLLTWLSSWSRRSEFAVYRMFGTTRSEVAFLVMAELGFVLLPALALGCAASLGALAVSLRGGGIPAHGIGEVLAAQSWAVGAAGMIGWALGAASVVVVAGGGLPEQLKDR